MKKLFLILIVIIPHFIILSQNLVSPNLKNNTFFIPNKGQWNNDVLFLTQQNGVDVWITKQGVTYNYYKIKKDSDSLIKGHVLKINNRFTSLNQTVKTKDKVNYYYNYFYGKNKHATNVELFKEVLIENIYPNISIRYYFDNANLRYDYIVNPKGSTEKIAFDIEGADNIKIRNNELSYNTCFGEIKHAELYTYQIINNKKIEIKSEFEIKNNQITFNIGAYNKNIPLIIDPIIYSTFLGGTNNETFNSITRDNSYNTYVTGRTLSLNFPVTSGVYQTSINGLNDIVISKLNNNGTNLIYSTFIGGNNEDYATSIALNTNGEIYITGSTGSNNFPTTSGVLQPSLGGGTDGFILKLNNNGTSIIYSTYLGGTLNDQGSSIKVDVNNDVYVKGTTASNDFPVTPGVVQPNLAGGRDMFVSKVNATGNALIYSTYIGGTSNETGNVNSLTIDNSGNAYIVGKSKSNDYPITIGAYQTTYSGLANGDCVVSKLNSTASNLVFSTYIGPGFGSQIALDLSSNVVVSGAVLAYTFPVTPGAYQTTAAGSYDAFISKLNPSGSSLLFSTFLGGINHDETTALVINKNNEIIVSCYTESPDFPVTADAYQSTNNGGNEVTISKLNSTLSTLIYSTFIGGTSSETALSMCTDDLNNVYLTGATNSNDYPITNGALQVSKSGLQDGFVTKFCFNTYATISEIGCGDYTVPSGDETYTVSGTYNDTIQNIAGCDSILTINVTIYPLPTVIANASSTTICAGQPVTLTGGGATSYTWDNGVTDGVAFNPTTTTTYTVTGTDANGCTNTANVTVTVNPLPNVTANASATTICAGQSVTLTGGGATSYSWDNGVTDGVAFNPTTTTTYTVTGTDANGCTNTASVTVTVNALPTVTANATATTICAGQPVTLTGGGATSYTWDNGVTDGVAFNPTTTTTYTITGTDANGCINTASVTVTVNPLPVINNITTIDATCGNSADGQISVSASGNNLSYSINGGTPQNNNVFTNLQAGNYTVEVLSNGCSVTQSVTINSPAPIIYNFNHQLPICSTDGYISLLITGGNSPYSVQWQHDTNLITDSININSTGQYIFTITDANSCSLTDTIILVGPGDPTIIIDLLTKNVSCDGLSDGEVIVDNVSGGIEPYSYQWDNGNNDSIISNLTPKNYEITITDANGCIGTATAVVGVDNDDCLDIHNAISPNGDGENDSWEITGIQGKENTNVKVFNRWGSLIFESDNYQNDWKGTYKGKDLPAGIYYYIVTIDGESFEGSLTIIR